jgi:hypothetical protein
MFIVNYNLFAILVKNYILSHKYKFPQRENNIKNKSLIITINFNDNNVFGIGNYNEIPPLSPLHASVFVASAQI